MPDPSNYADESAFMEDCVPMMVDEGKPQDQAVAACASMWADHGKAASAVDRAWSTLTVKSVDAERREIEGVASTPSVDRIGDIVRSEGGRFTLPLPLLYHHRHDQPVGHVIAAKATKAGITIKAKFAKIDEAGELKNRLDRAWQEVKAGLIRGLSIGFKPLEYELLEDGSGFDFKSWNWYELSLVTIPAQAEASITLVKSLDQAATGLDPAIPEGSDNASSATAGARAVGAAGSRSSRPRVSIGANSHREERSMSKLTTAERIREFEAARQAKAARMADIMEKSEGETLDDEQSGDYDGLKAEVKAIDEHLVRLRDLETINAAAAKPVEAKTLEDGAAARGPAPRVRMNDLSRMEPGIAFARLAKCLAIAKGDAWGALNVAKGQYPNDTRIHNVLEVGGKTGEVSSDMVERAASGAMMTGHSLGVGLVGDEGTIFADFVEWLRPQVLIGRFGTDGIPSLTRVPFRTPLITQTSGATGYWVGEGAGKPVTNFDATRRTLDPLKSAAIAVATKELIRDSSPSADALIRNELARAIRERVNLTFIDPGATAVAGISPAAITVGANSQASSGATADHVRQDLAALLNAYIVANNPPEQAVIIMTSARAMQLGLMRNALGGSEFPNINMRGGTLEGIPVLTSQLVSDTGSPAFGYVIMVNAADIWLAEEGGLMVAMSDQASLEMSTTPTQHVGGVGSPDTPVAAQLVSMFQTNSVAFLTEWTINWAIRRASGVQVLTGVSWNANATA